MINYTETGKKQTGRTNHFINCLQYAAAVLSGCIFILTASSWTSPLFPNAYGYDCAWYSLMGRAITQGKVPYVDYFDLKGPVFFFCEALGQALIPGRNGVFILQCVSISLTAILIIRTAGLYVGPALSAAVLTLFYFFYFYLLWGGNTVEELFLPVNMLAVYLCLDFFRRLKAGGEISVKAPAFLYGVGFGMLLFSKVTAAAPLIACVLTTLICLFTTDTGLYRRDNWRLIGMSALYFLVGLSALSLPVLTYFGLRKALHRMLFACFEFAFQRSISYYAGFSWEWERHLLICPAALLTALAVPAEREGEPALSEPLRVLTAVMSIVTYAVLHLGTPYTYYFITQLPLWCLTLTLCFSAAARIARGRGDEVSRTGDIEGYKTRITVSVRTFLSIIPPVVLLMCGWRDPVDKMQENISIWKGDFGRSKVEECLEIDALIPESQKEQVFNLESGMIYYEVTGDLPVNPYPVNLPYFLHLHPPIKEEVLDILRRDRPEWIISENLSGFDDEDIQEYVFFNYELIAYNDSEELYRRLEGS